ncbi:unnamed protein product [Oppiella nova]|uniref:Uncharacterized protein n=1 Tax=Oppiella nova TaxID=334625 RepID=A0A7R9MR88_9ACAR|nr:unnamed protein product [Oppiella nova]CAG2182200.1 unnamed protein product [Oppiella nova]
MIIQQMSEKVEFKDDELPQDNYEGVDPNEWVLRGRGREGQHWPPPTLSLGMSRNSDPCFKKTSPAVCEGFIPTPSSVMIALVAGVCLNCQWI